MEGLTNLFNSSIFSKLLPAGLFGAGEVGNILEERKRAAYQNYVMNLLKNPGQLAAMAAKIQQPLNNGLIQAVGNQVQGDVASRGLAQAPGIFAATESQALAPFYQQNQNTAMNAVLQSLGLPAGTFAPPQNLSPLLSLMMKTPSTTLPTVPTQTPAPTPGLTPPPPPPFSGGVTGDIPTDPNATAIWGGIG